MSSVGAPFVMLPGARLSVVNGKLMESLGQSHLAGGNYVEVGGMGPNYGIGTGIGMQAFAGSHGACCEPCAQGLPCAAGQADIGQGFRAMVGVPLILGIALYFVGKAYLK